MLDRIDDSWIEDATRAGRAVQNPRAPVRALDHRVERPLPIFRQFALNYDEAEGMDPEELKELYVRHIVKETVLRVVNIARRLKRRVEFRKFRTPATTGNRKVLVYEKDGVFLTLTIQRTAHEVGEDEEGKPRYQDVLNFTLEGLLGLREDEKPEKS